MRMALEFEKKDAAKYISHLDLQRAFSRAIRRSGLPVAFSKGFNPHYVMSFASALALGIESECELVEMSLESGLCPDEFLDAIAKALPPGLVARRAKAIPDDAPKMAASVREAEYKVFFEMENLGAIKTAVCDIMGSDEIIVSRGGKDTDIRKKIIALTVGDGRLDMRLAAAPSGSLRPDILVAELKRRAGGFDCRVVRLRLLAYSAGKSVDVYESF